MPIWYTFYTFICLREQIFENSIAREASFQEALALAERREVEKKGSILPLPHQAYLLIEKNWHRIPSFGFNDLFSRFYQSCIS